ncbi:MAG TPA: DUF2085 domain-containing protein [Longilinea sp.]|nr:DUF2085 domain-containing protein [Longilinea sp.]
MRAWPWKLIGKIVLVLGSAGLLIVWLVFTPTGLLGKMDAIGYAVCHRIIARSMFIDGRQFPLCYRCAGMYSGAFVSLIYTFSKGRHGQLPPNWIMYILGGFLVLFGIDGVNSYMHFFPNLPGLYQPQNWLRLLTGSGLGLAIPLLLVPVFHQTVWKESLPSAAVDDWKSFALLVGLVGLVDLAALNGNAYIVYLLAVADGLTVLTILTLAYSLVWIMVFKVENTYTTWRLAWFAVLSGFATALLQIALMDAVRFVLTGTWAGFIF